MITKALLKKPWQSPRGKMYPPGTTFKLMKRFPENSSSMYDFVIPGVCCGWVILSDKIFDLLSKKEKKLREIREKIRKEHFKNTNLNLSSLNYHTTVSTVPDPKI
jgi:adenine specific DNA methylase Mod